MKAIGRLNFRFSLELEGIQQFYIQEIDSPDFEVAEILQGAPGNEPDIKIPGKPKTGDLVIRKIKPINTNDIWAWQWLTQALGDPVASRKVGFLNELKVNAVNSEQRFYLGEVWPKKVSGIGYNAQGDGEKIIEEVTLSVRYFFPAELQALKKVLNI